jgi:hypothetical protein
VAEVIKLKPTPASPNVALYKEILTTVLDRRPSGTRQRLATALAKNRSFISQIVNPNYVVPIPVNHLDVIFEVCHFSELEKKNFMEAYAKAHPSRAGAPTEPSKLKPHTIYLPDLGDDARNRQLLVVVTDFVNQITRLTGTPLPIEDDR